MPAEIVLCYLQSQRWFQGDPRETRCCAAINAQAGEDGTVLLGAFRQLKRPQMELGADLKHNSLAVAALASQS